jgi:hypothetical protein
MVTPQLFKKASEERQERNREKTPEELLDMLRTLYKKYGKVTLPIINAEPDIPNHKYFTARFGSLAEAYLAAGVPADEPLLRARTRRSVVHMLTATISSVELMIERAGGSHIQGRKPWLLQINEQIVAKIVVARARLDSSGHIRWWIPINKTPIPDFVLCVQLDTANAGVMGYYLFPVSDFNQEHILLRAEHPDDRSEYRYATLAQIFGLSE